MKMRFICTTLLCACLTLLLSGCGASDQEKAQSLVAEGRQKMEDGQYNAARLLLDSVHSTYPKCVSERREAKKIEDEITYIESLRTRQYSDSLLQELLPKVDPLLKKFRYEKNERYEDNGKYVHRLLETGSNTSRCYLQAYVYDNRITEVKSYYFGTGVLQQNALELQANEEVCRMEATSHGFESEGYHSILTLEGDKALEVLNFISSHLADRLRVNLIGTTKNQRETNYVYYLNDSEKTALQDTYLLGILMNDVKQLEDAIRVANLKIEKYERAQ